ncbi:MAG: hypothetical protein VX278_23065, partial [Myxococcota bacterium]|nr:hypothetical protein [Myxococcota bacterium]
MESQVSLSRFIEMISLHFKRKDYVALYPKDKYLPLTVLTHILCKTPPPTTAEEYVLKEYEDVERL